MAFTEKRLAALALIALAIAVAIVVSPRQGALANAPYRPRLDADVLERLPARATDAPTRELFDMRRSLEGDPRNLALATALARRDIEEGRRRSDPRYLGYAEAALAPWWRAESPPADVLLLRATIRQSSHDFVGALADLDTLTQLTPNDPQMWLTRSVVLGVRGEYGPALESCARLAALTRGLVVPCCTENIRSLTGSAKDAYAKLESAVSAVRTTSPQETAWASSTLGEVAIRAGDPSSAERHFLRTLAIDPEDAYVLGAYTDLLLDLNRPREASARLIAHTQNDALLLRLALAETRVGDAAAPEHTRVLEERYDASHARGDTVHRREEARFALDLAHDPRRALALASANFDVQKEPWDVRIILEAALAAGDAKSAGPALEFLKANHLEDPSVVAAATKLVEARR